MCAIVYQQFPWLIKYGSSVVVLSNTCVVVFPPLQECLSKAFGAADHYSSKFEPYLEFYIENEKLQLEVFEEAGYGE